MTKQERKPEPCVTLVTGTPGVGKTKFADMLGRKTSARVVHLSSFISRHECFKRIDRARKTRVADLEKTRVLLHHLIQAEPSKAFVIEGHLTPLVVDPKDVKVCFVLRCHPQTLKTRLQRRRYPASKIAENLMAEILDNCLLEAVERLGREKVSELDTTSSSIKTLIDEALRVLGEELKPRVGTISWVDEFEKAGELPQYLSELSAGKK